jgi:membrane-bound lytic murein transglycosylase B
MGCRCEVPPAPVRLAIGSEQNSSAVWSASTTSGSAGHGRVFSGRDPPAGLVSIFELPDAGQTSKFMAGFNNFEVVTRYNRSTFYASAVLELGEAIRKAHGLVQLAAASPKLTFCPI